MKRLFAIAMLLSVSAHATAAELRYGATEHQNRHVARQRCRSFLGNRSLRCSTSCIHAVVTTP